jgi:hypothetical protein
MWMKLREWWYLRGKPADIPRDVREHIIRRHLQTLRVGKFSPAEKSKAAENLYMGSVGLGADQISSALRDEMAAACLNLLSEIPGDQCVLCKKPVFKHESVKTEWGYVCDLCKGKKPFT